MKIRREKRKSLFTKGENQGLKDGNRVFTRGEDTRLFRTPKKKKKTSFVQVYCKEVNGWHLRGIHDLFTTVIPSRNF